MIAVRASLAVACLIFLAQSFSLLKRDDVVTGTAEQDSVFWLFVSKVFVCDMMTVHRSDKVCVSFAAATSQHVPEKYTVLPQSFVVRIRMTTRGTPCIR